MDVFLVCESIAASAIVLTLTNRGFYHSLVRTGWVRAASVAGVEGPVFAAFTPVARMTALLMFSMGVGSEVLSQYRIAVYHWHCCAVFVLYLALLAWWTLRNWLRLAAKIKQTATDTQRKAAPHFGE